MGARFRVFKIPIESDDPEDIERFLNFFWEGVSNEARRDGLRVILTKFFTYRRKLYVAFLLAPQK